MMLTAQITAALSGPPVCPTRPSSPAPELLHLRPRRLGPSTFKARRGADGALLNFSLKVLGLHAE